MLAYKFETEISESGLIEIPREILDKIKQHLVEIVILENGVEDELTDRKIRDDIERLRGKYKGYLSTTEEFSKMKAYEKEKDL